MFFIRYGGAIAWILVLLGVICVAVGVFMAITARALELPAAAAPYLGLVTGTAPETIGAGLMMFLTGIVIGLLAQIAKGVKFD